MTGCLRIMGFSLNILFFSMVWLLYCIKEEKHVRFKYFLTHRKASHLYEPLKYAGVWNLEQLITANMFIFPNEILRLKDVRAKFRSIKADALEQITWVYWMRERGWRRYVTYDKGYNLNLFGYSYSDAESIKFIATDCLSLSYIDDTTKHSLHSDVYRFRQAMRDYAYGSRSPILVAKKHQYKNFLESFRGFTVIDFPEILEHIYDYPQTILNMILFAFLQHWIVSLAVQNKVPGNSNAIPLLMIMYMNPALGSAAFAIVLLRKMFKDPVKTFVWGLFLGLWMFLIVNQPETSWIRTFSLIPVISIFTLCMLLRFNPIHTKRKATLKQQNDKDKKNIENQESTADQSPKANASKGESGQKCKSTGIVSAEEQSELLICGIGCVDLQLEIFLKGGLLNAIWSWISSASNKVPSNKTIETLNHIILEDVDVHWSQLKYLIKPSIKSGRLKSFQMINNRAFTDIDAIEMTELLDGNESIEKLSIIVDYQKTLSEKLYYFLLWDNCLPAFSCSGIYHIINKLLKMKDNSISFLDFYGIELDKKTVQVAKDLNKRHGTRIFGCQPNEAPGTMLTTLNSWIVKLLCYILVMTMIISLFTLCLTYY